MEKSWIEAKVEIHPSLLEAVANFLIEQGSPGVIQEEASGGPDQPRERLTAYLVRNRSSETKKEKIRAYVRDIGKLHRGPARLRFRVIREEKWAEAWKKNFRPIQVTTRMVIKPPWEEYRQKQEEIVITIDPGMAFGTGTHPTTQLCLQALERLIPTWLHPPSVLDLGTGSGILAIAARKLGAQKVWATDTDPIALDCARKNALANSMDHRLFFCPGPLGGVRRVFDILVANLLPQELLPMIPILRKKMGHRGGLIVSGFLQTQKEEITSALAKEGLVIYKAYRIKEWACFVAWRKAER